MCCQERALDLPGLELQMVAKYHGGAGESTLGPLEEQLQLWTTERFQRQCVYRRHTYKMGQGLTNGKVGPKMAGSCEKTNMEAGSPHYLVTTPVMETRSKE